MNRKKWIVTLVLALVLLLVIVDLGRTDWSFDRFIEKAVAIGGITSSTQNISEATPYASRRGEMYLPLGDVTELCLENKRGSINILGEEGRETIALEYMITVFATDEEEAKAYLPNLDIQYEESSNLLAFTCLWDDRDSPAQILGVEIDYNFIVPKHIEVKVKNAFGQVQVSDLAGVELENKFGNSEIRRIAGSVNTKTSYGEYLWVEDIIGDVISYTFFNQAGFNNIEGNVTITAKYGSVDISKTKGGVHLETHFLKASLFDLAGNLVINAAYTDVLVHDLKGSLMGTTHFGTLYIRNLDGPVELRGSYTDFEVCITRDISVFSFDCLQEAGTLRSEFDLPITSSENPLVSRLIHTNPDAEHLVKIYNKFGKTYLRE